MQLNAFSCCIRFGEQIQKPEIRILRYQIRHYYMLIILAITLNTDYNIMLFRIYDFRKSFASHEDTKLITQIVAGPFFFERRNSSKI